MVRQAATWEWVHRKALEKSLLLRCLGMCSGWCERAAQRKSTGRRVGRAPHAEGLRHSRRIGEQERLTSPRGIEAGPKDTAGVENLGGATVKGALVGDASLGVRFLELFHGVCGMLRLEGLVETPEAEGHLGWELVTTVELLEAVDEAVPKACIRPVLNRKGGTQSDGRVVAAVNLLRGCWARDFVTYRGSHGTRGQLWGSGRT